MARCEFKYRYANHKARAKKRNIPFLLSFVEWKQIWLNSGQWENRGRGKGKCVMSRINDIGPYAVDNVFIQTFEGNSSDGHKDKKQSSIHIARRAESLKGKPSGMLGKTPWNKGIKGYKLKTNIKENTL